MLDRALEVLLSEDLAHVVDLVLLAREGIIEAHTPRGSCGFTRRGLEWETGDNPLARQETSTFTPLTAERAGVRPRQGNNAYPFAYDNAAQLFADPRAPDLAVCHTPAHNWEERGGHRGEHGSLNIVQSRAPLILAGGGVKKLGRIDSAARMIDVAPTICALLGVPPRTDGTLLARQEGRVLTEVLDGTRPDHVVAFLCDGTNPNVLYEMAGSGELPTVARLMGEGTTFNHGLIASFPSVTLANHTTAMTGTHPGTHGVLHNAYYDRVARRHIITNAPETWHLARNETSAEVETIHEVVARTIGGFTAGVNEPSDRGAGYTTFDLLRRGGMDAIRQALPMPEQVPGTTQEFADIKREYAWASNADFIALNQVTGLWHRKPKFLWVNMILPDAANHAGGPYSDIGHAGLRDTDRRLGTMLEEMDWDFDHTAFVLLADHGMEESDPGCKGDWDAELTKAGLRFRDEAYGFIYLDP